MIPEIRGGELFGGKNRAPVIYLKTKIFVAKVKLRIMVLICLLLNLYNSIYNKNAKSTIHFDVSKS